MTSAYLDYNATAPLRPQARDALMAALDLGGNPSSVHRAGRRARRTVDDARARVAELAGASGDDVVFTSGGTEANWLAIEGAARAGRVGRMVVSAIEHPSVLAAAAATGLPVETVGVGSDGVLALDDLQAALAVSSVPALVCLMAANNETGVIQPVAAAAECARAHGAMVHVDAVQAAGKIGLAPFQDADTVALSAHKLGGAQGTGALILRDPDAVAPLIPGGGQEGRRRAGTENVPGIAAFGAAAHACRDGDADIACLRDEIERHARAIGSAAGYRVRVAGEGADRLSNTACLSFAGLRAETLVMAFDLAGVCVSAGSACSSGKVTRSHVLTAMGWEEPLADGAIRISLGWASTHEDVDRFASALEAVLARMGPSKINAADAAYAAAR